MLLNFYFKRFVISLFNSFSIYYKIHWKIIKLYFIIFSEMSSPGQIIGINGVSFTNFCQFYWHKKFLSLTHWYFISFLFSSSQFPYCFSSQLKLSHSNNPARWRQTTFCVADFDESVFYCTFKGQPMVDEEVTVLTLNLLLQHNNQGI